MEVGKTWGSFYIPPEMKLDVKFTLEQTTKTEAGSRYILTYLWAR
jgi:hypothetical protein